MVNARSMDQLTLFALSSLVLCVVAGERIVFCSLSSLQTALYKAALETPDCQLVMSRDDFCPCGSKRKRGKCCHKPKEGKKGLTFHYTQLFLKISNHASLLLPCHKQSEGQKEMATDICKAVFQDFPEFEQLYEHCSFSKMSDPEFCGKMVILDKLLTAMKKSKDKVLLFSHSAQLLNILEAYVVGRGYVYRRFDGDTKPDHRGAIVREFNKSPDIFLCLITTKTGGLGLNITGANIVIIFDPSWNPSYDNQAQDRAFRIGQHRNVKVYRLISSGSIEENIYLRQIYKQQLANIAIQTSNERRFFTGVAGSKTLKGELFGIKNMFTLRQDGSSFAGDVIKRTELVEAGVKMEKYELSSIEEKKSDQNVKEIFKEEEEEAELSSDADDDYLQYASQFVEEIVSEDDEQDPKRQDEVESRGMEGKCRRKEPPLLWQNKDTSCSDVDDGGKFTKLKSDKSRKRGAISKGVQFDVSSSSDEDGRSKEGQTTNMHRKKLLKKKKKKVDTRKEREGSDHSNSQETPGTSVDNLLEECGVKYSHSNRRLFGTNAAEDKMSSKAIKDVFWLGLNSQEPAHNVDISASEESDDIEISSTCKNKKIKSLEKTSKDKTAIENDKSKTRIFERVENDMFLIGDTPPAIRRKHFEEMTQDNNFATIYEFAKHAVNQPEEESIKLLKDYYLKHEPTIESVSSFKDVYSTRPRRFLDDSNSPNFKTNVTGSEPNLLLPGPKSQKSENKSGRLKASSSAVATKNTKDRDNNFTKRLKEEREKLRAGEPSQSTTSKASRPNKPRNVKRNMIRQTSKPLRKISARENSASYCRSSTSSDENSDWIPSTLPEKLTPPSLVGGSRRRQESRSILDIFDPDEPFDQKLSTPDRKCPDLMDMVLSNQRSDRRSDQLDSQTQISLDDDRSSLVKSEDRTYDDLLDEQNFLSPKRAKRKDSYSVLDDFLNMTSHERRGNENSYTNAEMRNMHFLSDEDETSDKEVSIIDELMGCTVRNFP